MPELLDTEALAVDLWEAKYNADQLKAMLAKGQAIKNDNDEPSYPIGDEQDLQRAISAVGRGGMGHDRIRRYIIGRAKALGKSDAIPDAWSKSGASKGATEEASRVPGPLLEQGRICEVRLRESDPPLTPKSSIALQLIDAGWSKNGRYYPESTLAEAARAGVFKAGTPMFIDHPTVSEQVERPERSLRDLATRLTSDARYQNGALVAEARCGQALRNLIEELGKDNVGLSIRAAGTLEYGEAEGREGPVVTSLAEGISVDFVTSPARGGKILELIESVRAAPLEQLTEARNIGAWLESRLHLAFTQLTDDMYGNGRLSREERIALSSAVGDALATFTSRVEGDQPQLYKRDLWQGPDVDAEEMDEARRLIAEGHGMTAHDLEAALSDAVRATHGAKNIYAWTCDHTDEWVVYRVDTDTGKGGLFQQAYTVTDGAVLLTGKSTEVTAHTTYTPAGQAPPATDPKPVPAAEADRTQNAPGSPPADTPPIKEEGSMPELTEAEARALQEARDTALAEAEKARNEAAADRAAKTESDLKLARFEATEAARPIAASLLTESDLPAAAQGRLISSLVTSQSVPLTGDSKLDEGAFRKAVADAIKDEQTYVASLAEQAGAGVPRGLGESSTGAADEVVAKDVTEGLVESYKANGLSPAAAQLAATGRPF